MRFSVIRASDLAIYVAVPIAFGSFMIAVSGAQLGIPLARIVGWNVFMAMCVISALVLYRRASLVDVFRFRTRQKVLVGWSKPKYAVRKDDVESVIEDTVSKLEGEYVGARYAVAGCVVLFREPTWISLATFRRVSGEQDGLLLTVGWKKNITDTDLSHELAHRVLQVCAEDPEEIEAHEILDRLKL